MEPVQYYTHLLSKIVVNKVSHSCVCVCVCVRVVCVCVRACCVCVCVCMCILQVGCSTEYMDR